MSSPVGLSGFLTLNRADQHCAVRNNEIISNVYPEFSLTPNLEYFIQFLSLTPACCKVSVEKV